MQAYTESSCEYPPGPLLLDVSCNMSEHLNYMYIAQESWYMLHPRTLREIRAA